MSILQQKKNIDIKTVSTPKYQFVLLAPLDPFFGHFQMAHLCNLL